MCTDRYFLSHCSVYQENRFLLTAYDDDDDDDLYIQQIRTMVHYYNGG